jgi:DNA repair protein RadC
MTVQEKPSSFPDAQERSDHTLQDAVASLAILWRNMRREQLAVLHHFGEYGSVYIQQLNQGNDRRVALPLRDMLRASDRYKSFGLTLVHSHPQGSSSPSERDRITTQRLADMCRFLDLILFDHVIIARHDRFSFREMGLL